MSDNINYYNKYLKYKNKYLRLKGGNSINNSHSRGSKTNLQEEKDEYLQELNDLKPQFSTYCMRYAELLQKIMTVANNWLELIKNDTKLIKLINTARDDVTACKKKHIFIHKAMCEKFQTKISDLLKPDTKKYKDIKTAFVELYNKNNNTSFNISLFKDVSDIVSNKNFANFTAGDVIKELPYKPNIEDIDYEIVKFHEIYNDYYEKGFILR